MNNLSVVWHPGGWKHSYFDFNATHRSHLNLISQRKWRHAPDFRWFVGDEPPYFDSRASNELMYIRGVGSLRPEPIAEFGPYATYNADVVDSILICAVRSAYEGLIDRLKCSFEVDVVDAFDFVIRDEVDDSAARSSQFPIRRVAAWSLENAEDLRIRREQEEATQREKRGRAELADISQIHGFSLEVFLDALVLASSKRSNGSGPTSEVVDRRAAKRLRDAGFKLDAGTVRHLRQLIELYEIEALPEALRPDTTRKDETDLRKVVDIASFR
jgi:hypothetical protein